MVMLPRLFLLCFMMAVSGCAEAESFKGPNGERKAVSLSYDDALASQLDNAVEALNKRGIKVSFYPSPNSEVFQRRLPEWIALAKQGHELGNHTLFHSCKRSLAGDWVKDYQNLDNFSTEDMMRNIRITNALLQSIDGKKERTLTPACGHTKTTDGDYLPNVEKMFVGVKYVGKEHPSEVLMMPDGHTAEDVIKFIESAPKDKPVVNILFHGVGGDYLSIASKEHEKVLDYLVANKDKYWTDTYLNIRKRQASH